MPLPTPVDTPPALFADKTDIETPAIVVDLDVMDRNLETYARIADDHDVALRSHAKTHKIPDIAHRQDELTGGDGILCQTLSEVEVMAQNGIDDIYLSYMVVEDSKLDRMVWLSEKLDAFATTVDCPGNIRPVQEAAARHDTTIDVILEIDIGLDRVGVEPGEPTVEMAEFIREQPNLSLAGVMAYEGHIRFGEEGTETEDAFERRCLETMDEVEETVELLETAGIPIDDVKVGSTKTSPYSATHPVVTEINPGMYPFMDAHLIDTAPNVEKDDCALTVLTTVISTPTDDRVVVDAGSKTISLELDYPPIPKERDDIHYYNASEEHGWIDTSDATETIDVGDRIDFIPPHVCPTINLHDTVVGVRDDRVEEVWNVQARGKVK